MDQHCTGDFLVQCWPRQIQTTKDPENIDKTVDCGPPLSEAAVGRCSSKYVLIKISQYSQESTCVGVFLNKVAALKACNFIKK